MLGLKKKTKAPPKRPYVITRLFKPLEGTTETTVVGPFISKEAALYYADYWHTDNLPFCEETLYWSQAENVQDAKKELEEKENG